MRRVNLTIVTLATLLMAWCGSVSAEVQCDSISVNGLPPAAVEVLKATCKAQATATQPANGPQVATPGLTKESADAWGHLAKEFAAAIGIAAREIGVSANEFISTPAGMITVAVILWSTIGDSVSALLLILIVVWGAAGLIRTIWTESYQLQEQHRWWTPVPKIKRVRVYYNWRRAEESQVVSLFLILLVVTMILVLVLT